MVRLQNGCLEKAYQKTCEGICTYDCRTHARTYVGEFGDMNAEPEFTGKYIDICTKYYTETGDKKYLERAETVVRSILEHQGEDGYLGMLSDDLRWKNFSVWNQAFTVLGLLSYYRGTGDKKALAAAEKCAGYVARHYLEHPEDDILNAGNYGTQNISFLIVLPELYQYTGNQLYYDFMMHIVEKIKNSKLNFFEFDKILDLQSPKAIENFVVLIGILRYGELTGDESAFRGASRYWQQIADTQIRNTGNGSLHEIWVEGGNAPMLLDEACRPNETCVAVGWIELSLILFQKYHDVKYLDAIEKTLYNHLLGSLSDDGSDFAYYQPNYGRKIFVTSEKVYKCCRYRGFTLFAYLKDMLYYVDEEQIIPVLYQASEYEDENTHILQETAYPYDLTLRFTVTHKKGPGRCLKLGIPAWCRSYTVTVSGGCTWTDTGEGFLEIRGQGSVELAFDHSVQPEYGRIDDKEYVAFHYGPLLLAAVNPGGIEGISVKRGTALRKVQSTDGEQILFEQNGCKDGKAAKLYFKDYASAGREEDEQYTVWIPVAE